MNQISTNYWWVALLVYGEGWHNNHHTFQYSARHGMQWWEIDLTWMIQLLQALVPLECKASWERTMRSGIRVRVGGQGSG